MLTDAERLTRLCRLCHERPCTPSRAKNRDYRCTRCISRTAQGRARNARYNAGEKRRAMVKRDNAKRIFVGASYHSRTRTREAAQQINAIIKERRREFVERQSHRKETQGASAR